MRKLAIITTHPIQYNAPFFSLLAQRANIKVKVFYTWSQTQTGAKFDPGFGKEISWDIPLLQGYEFAFVENTSKNPGSHHFFGIENPSLKDEVAAFSPNAILVYGWSFKSHLQLIKYFKGKIPIWFRGDSTILTQQGFFKRILRKLWLTWVYKNVDVALFPGEANKQYSLEYGLKQDQLKWMPHAIDNDRFFSNDKILNEAIVLREKLNISSEEVVFLFAGKLEPIKQPVMLIDAFNLANLTKAKLVILGNGSLEILLKNKGRNNSNIIFVDFQNQSAMPAWYAMSDVFVLPSKSETWGLAINEAMAAGKPVIASEACGATLNLVKPNQTGFVFKSNDPISLANALAESYQLKDSWGSYSKNAIQLIENYSFAKQCEAVESLINSIS
jgi:glycosyltransferase involved in cell wall biosynthesis